MLAYIFFSLMSIVQASTGSDVFGYWSKVGECGSKFIDFGSNGVMTHYETVGGRYVAQSAVEWWITDGYIMTGNQAADYVVMGIKVDIVNSLMFTGTMVFPDGSTVPFIWEKCK